MNLRTRLSRSNGYRELGMFDESILILEDIPLLTLDHSITSCLDKWMPSDKFHKLAKEELASSPNEELLLKSISDAGGDEKKGKALYIETRSNQMEDDFEDLLTHSTSCVIEDAFASLLEEDEEDTCWAKIVPIGESSVGAMGIVCKPPKFLAYPRGLTVEVGFVFVDLCWWEYFYF